MVKDIILNMSTKMPSLSGMVSSGGMLNAGMALFLANAIMPPEVIIPPVLPEVSADPPRNTRVSATTQNNLTIAWDAPENSTGVRGYEVLRNGVHIGEADANAPHVFTDNTLSPGIDYSYAVRSEVLSNPSNRAIASTEYISIRPPAPSLSLGGVSGNGVTLLWTRIIDVTSYNIYRGTSQGNMTLIHNAPATASSHTDATVQSGNRYYYYMTALNSMGEESLPSTTVTANV
jgi:chitin-binding protein